MQAKARDAYAEAVRERDESKGEKKPSVMEYLGLKKKVADLQQIAHAMKMKVLPSITRVVLRNSACLLGASHVATSWSE